MKTQYAVVQGRTVIVKGHRFFAIPRVEQNVDRIAKQTNLRGNWNRIDEQPRGSRVIVNQHR